MTVDYAYEALAAATQTDMTQGRGQLNAALKAIREQTTLRDADLAAEIERRARSYRVLMAGAVLTPSALAKHWLRCAEATQPTQQTNRSVSVTCQTCGGDRFVTYAMRRPQQSVWMKEKGIEPHYDRLIEEVAPCPDCNPVDDPRLPDPAQVRERIAR